jgi:hypothetical protein
MKLASLETGIVLLPNDEPLAGFSENPNASNCAPMTALRGSVSPISVAR